MGSKNGQLDPHDIEPVSGKSYETGTLALTGATGRTIARVLKAAVTILAGDLGCPYDQIVQIRVATSEMSDLFLSKPSEGLESDRPIQVSVRLDRYANRLEISLTGVLMTPHDLIDGAQNIESMKVLRSLVDELRVTLDKQGTTTVCIVRYTSPKGEQR